MRITVAIYLLLLFCLVGCHTKSINYPEGGYAYLQNVTDSDSDYYFLPIRTLIPRTDSMAYARAKYFYQSFDEPNLSINAAKEDIFRLSVDGGGFANNVFITLTHDGLLVKQQKPGNTGSPYPIENNEQLSEVERQHYFFLQRFFPLGKRSYTHGRQLYIDSMIKAYPKLSDATYYQYLMDKVIDKNAELFEYTSKRIPLTPKQVNSLIDSINTSGYWKLPYQPLAESGTDGWGFCLEANLPTKYNVVGCNGIQKTPGTDKFKQVCQQLLDYAKIDAAPKIWDKDR